MWSNQVKVTKPGQNIVSSVTTIKTLDELARVKLDNMLLQRAMGNG